MRNNRIAPEVDQLLRREPGSETRKRFSVTDEGVFWLKRDANGTKRIKLSSRVDILARGRDIDGKRHGRLLKWQDHDGREHEWFMPMELLASDTTQVRQKLLSDGLPYLTMNRQNREKFAEYLQTENVTRRLRCVQRLGWHGGVYVLPDHTFGSDGCEIFRYEASQTTPNHWTSKGQLEDWHKHIGAVCQGNSRLVFAASCSFAGPLLSIAGAESGGVHFVGATSTGKTTALRVAASVCGTPEFMQTWRTTANALEATAHAHNDAPLILDELAQLDPSEATHTAYLLANGQGKGRLSRDTSLRAQLAWRLLFVSSGEISLSEHASSVGRKIKGGVDVRLLNIPADARAGMGLFEDLHHYSTPNGFADGLRDQARRYYGTPFLQFLSKLAANKDQIERKLLSLQRAFLEDTVAGGEVVGEVKRAAGRFALVGAAGEIASEFGITGWNEGESIKAAKRCYQDWLTQRGTTGSSELHNAVDQVRAFLEMHGASRFQLINLRTEEEANIRDRAGFRRPNLQTGELEFLVFSQTFKGEVCRGFNYREVAHELINKGLLERQGESLMYKTSVPGFVPDWYFCISARILDSREASANTL